MNIELILVSPESVDCIQFHLEMARLLLYVQDKLLFNMEGIIHKLNWHCLELQNWFYLCFIVHVYPKLDFSSEKRQFLTGRLVEYLAHRCSINIWMYSIFIAE